MLKIWGRASSVNVQKVLWCAEELGLPFERIDIGGPFGGNRDAAYLALNPNAVVPTIEDDGFVLWESNTIVRYLAAKHGMGRLCPSDVQRRADGERWMDWQLTTLNKDMVTLFWGLIRTAPEKRDTTAIAGALEALGDIWGRLDRHLADRAFIGGAALTMADIPAGALAYRWFNLQVKRPALPRLEAWYQRLTERPGYAKHVMIVMT